MNAPVTSGSTQSTIPTKRRRSALACEPCRRKKTKCDRNMPCNRCQRSGSDICHYGVDDYVLVMPDSNQANNPPSRQPSADIMNDPAPFTFEPKDAQTSKSSSSHQSLPAHRHSISFPGFSQSGGTQEQICDRQSWSRTRSEDMALVNHTDALAVDSSTPSYDDRVSARGLFWNGRYFGPSHWMNNIGQFHEVLTVIRTVEADDISTHRPMVAKAKDLARRLLKTKDLSTPIGNPSLHDLVPSTDVVDRLLQAYLRTLEPIFRILHIPTFKKAYISYRTKPDTADLGFIVQLLLVLAIGVTFVSQEEECLSLRSTAAIWISTAHTYINTAPEKTRCSLPGLQTQCLLLLAREVNNGGGDSSAITTGSLVRNAMMLGLHIDPVHFASISIFEGEVRRRIWYTILELDLQSAMDTGGVPMVGSHDYNTRLPMNIDDEQIEENNHIPPMPKPQGQITSSLPQLMLARSLALRSEMAKRINDFQTGLTFDGTLKLAARLMPYLRSNSKSFEMMQTDKSCSAIFTAKMIDLLTQRFLLSLHHPFAIQARSNHQFYYSRKEAVEVALSIISSCLEISDQQQQQRSPEVDDFRNLILRAAGIFRNVPLQAISTICAEAIYHFEEAQISFKPLSSAIPFRDMHKAVEKYVECTAIRVKYGETNVKGYVLFACILAQIDAMQTGLPADSAVTAALWRSIDQCSQLLDVGNTRNISKRLLRDDLTSKAVTTTTSSASNQGLVTPLVVTTSSLPSSEYMAYQDPPIFLSSLGPMFSFDHTEEWLLETDTTDFSFFSPLLEDF